MGPPYSGSGLVPAKAFYSYRYWTDRMPDTLAFRPPCETTIWGLSDTESLYSLTIPQKQIQRALSSEEMRT